MSFLLDMQLARILVTITSAFLQWNAPVTEDSQYSKLISNLCCPPPTAQTSLCRLSTNLLNLCFLATPMHSLQPFGTIKSPSCTCDFSSLLFVPLRRQNMQKGRFRGSSSSSSYSISRFQCNVKKSENLYSLNLTCLVLWHFTISSTVSLLTTVDSVPPDGVLCITQTSLTDDVSWYESSPCIPPTSGSVSP